MDISIFVIVLILYIPWVVGRINASIVRDFDAKIAFLQKQVDRLESKIKNG